MEGGDTGGYSHGVLKSMTNDKCHSSFGFIFIPGRSLLSVGASFPYVGSHFCTWAVVAWWWWWWWSAVAGLSIWLPHCCRWQGGGVGCLSPLVPFLGGVLSWSRHHLITWCHPAIVVAWSLSVVVVVVVSHCCSQLWLLTWHSCIVRMVYQCVQVVVGGGWWCGDDGWALWVGIVGGGGG